MKSAHDYLVDPPQTPPPASFLYGDDSYFRVLVTNILKNAAGIKDSTDVERLEVKSGDQIVSRLLDGSLFGKQFWVFELEGSWGHPAHIAEALTAAKESGDTVVVRAAELPATDPPLSRFFNLVDCRGPRTERQRKKFVALRMAHHQVKLPGDVLQILAERTTDAAEIDNLLYYLSLQGPRVTVQDVMRVTSNPRRDQITLSVLRGNYSVLYRVVHEKEPLYVLTALYDTLLRLFVWLECEAAGDRMKEVAELLEIQVWWRKEWRAAHQRYSSQAVGKLLSQVMAAYEAATSGDEKWRWPLLSELRKILVGR